MIYAASATVVPLTTSGYSTDTSFADKSTLAVFLSEETLSCNSTASIGLAWSKLSTVGVPSKIYPLFAVTVRTPLSTLYVVLGILLFIVYAIFTMFYR